MMAETVEQAALGFVSQSVCARGTTTPKRHDLESGFLAGAAWQKERNFRTLDKWAKVCADRDTELAAIREKARELRPQISSIRGFDEFTDSVADLIEEVAGEPDA